MMDLGLGSVIDKFEEYFGRKVTRAILVLIGLAVVAGCVSVVWTWLVAPLLAFFSTPLWGRTITSLSLTVLAIGGGLALSFNVSASMLRWRHLRSAKELLDKSEKVFETSKANDKMRREEYNEIIDKAGTIFDQTLAMLRAVIELNPGLTPEERVELVKSLVDIRKPDGA